MKNTVKRNLLSRWLAMTLAMCLLLISLTACRTEGAVSSDTDESSFESSQSSPPESSQDRESSAPSQVISAQDTPEPASGGEKLRVVTDLDSRWAGSIDGQGLSAADEGRKAFQKMLDHFGGVPGGMEVELEVLPVENGDYKAQLAHIRTEIMSGGGPDVFLLSCGPIARNGNTDGLFPNPEHAMHSGFFLPLDQYIAQAQLVDWEDLNPKVLEAGRTEKGQMILPLFYSLPLGIVTGEQDPAALPADWNGALSGGDQTVKNAYADLLYFNLGFRGLAFGQIADNQTEEMAVSKEEVFAKAKEAVEMNRERAKTYEQDTGSGGAVIGGGASTGLDWFPFYPQQAYDEKGNLREDVTWFQIRNSNGDIPGCVTTYCAVNANTQHPEEAFFVAEMLMTEKFQRLEIFYNKKAREKQMPLRMFAAANGGGVPVNRRVLASEGDTMGYRQIPELERQAINQAREEVGYCYIPSDVDVEMNRLFFDVQDLGADAADGEVQKLVDKHYMTMRMMLGEA